MPHPAALTSTGLIGGFAVAQKAGHRYAGGSIAAAAGLGAMESCRRRRGISPTLVLGTAYAASLAGSHPLAKKLGAWPAVCTATAATAVASHVLSRPRRT